MHSVRTSILALIGLAAVAVADTVHGVVVFARHGDRTTKHFSSQVLTPLGARQLFQVGSDYRARYLSSASSHRINSISESMYVPGQIDASAPDEAVLLSTATSFLQGLYPPIGDDQAGISVQQLANGSSVTTPLEGYQYVTLHGVSSDSPDAIWMKGDDNCPALNAAAASFSNSAEYASRFAATRDFYASLHPFVSSVYPSPSSMTYAHAYDIFDLLNVARLHNASSKVAEELTAAQLFQLRTLADSAEFARNYNASQPDRSIHARTLIGAVLQRLTNTAASVTGGASAPKFSLLAGSYDTFLAFFGVTRLTETSTDFYGLPEYASTMAFELFSPGDATLSSEEDLRVRFLFRNGTEGSLTEFPLFGKGEKDLSWTEFAGAMKELAIDSAADWCSACRSEAVFCAAYRGRDGVDVAGAGQEVGVSRGSWIAALVVMSVAVVGNLAWAGAWLVQRRGSKRAVGERVRKETDFDEEAA
ncbi:hypothetical protein VTJ49DRAFT_2468 [Mycothermus thermophilus]|uniref:Acid phosphatase n=1 Tax=Humicola insolens TaxID=85995 RepID=A0ABR3VB63_HUMIN